MQATEEGWPELVRVGDKLISRPRVHEQVDKILDLRRDGFSQQEVAARMGVDRSFVSRLEGLGEVRRGARIALVGFPVANGAELQQVAVQKGVEFVLLWTDAERRTFLQTTSGLQLLNWLLEKVALVRDFDHVVLLGSRYRIRVVEALLGRPVTGVVLGPSPLTRDVHVDPGRLASLLDTLRGEARVSPDPAVDTDAPRDVK